MKRVLVVAVAALGMAGAQAQDYPVKTIRLIVPLTTGAGADIAARIVAQRMSEHWKQPVIVDNRPGAGGQIGTSAVVKAEPDGHTLLVQSSSHSANPAIYRNLPYDPLKDLIDVAILGKTPYVMVSAGNGPYRSLKAAARSGESEAGRDRLLLRRPWHLDPPRGRVSDRPRRRAHDPRALQGLAGSAAGRARRPLGFLHGAGERGARPGEGRQAQRARRIHEHARRGAAAGADARRAGPAGLRSDAVVRPVGAGRHASRRWCRS